MSHENKQTYIRNFSIIAHIDHGKSTLADRIIENTGLVATRDMKAQYLDNMDIERERGITIKLQTSRLNYKAKDGHLYTFNLIDTPGHVDFTYEVSRSLAACEGALLIVDAAQGVEAQTLANVYLAEAEGLEIVPILNKIDLPSARPDEIKEQIEDILAIEASDAPLISAKSGLNIQDVLEAVVNKIPPPNGIEKAPLKALIFDSYYDAYKGTIVYARIFDGKVKKGDKIKLMSNNISYEVVEVGVMVPAPTPVPFLEAGDVGYIAASIKQMSDVRVGDTLTSLEHPTPEPCPGYKKIMPMVYCGIYPAEGEKYEDVRDALEKLHVNDAAFVFEPETSIALGFGFRCGFLGLLHLEIITERIEREFDIGIVTTSPSVTYKVHKNDGEVLMIQNPSNLPDPTEIDFIEEPMVKADIMIPNEYVGNIMEICQDRRGTMLHMEYITETRVVLHYEMPLNEVIYDFFDALKSKTKGYGSLDYDFTEYKASHLVKLDILLNKDVIDAFSMIVHETKAYARGKVICEKLKDLIPKQQFEIPIQASIGNKIISRETIRALRKDVTAKCYGGDISRKRKLLEKQKKGKKRMRQFGSVEVPQEAFTAVLKYDDSK